MSKENAVCSDDVQQMTKHNIPQILAEALAKSPKLDACVEGHGIPNCVPASKVLKGATAAM